MCILCLKTLLDFVSGSTVGEPREYPAVSLYLHPESEPDAGHRCHCVQVHIAPVAATAADRMSRETRRQRLSLIECRYIE